VKLCTEKGLNFVTVIGSTTMTMLWLTGHSLWSSFWYRSHLL